MNSGYLHLGRFCSNSFRRGEYRGHFLLFCQWSKVKMDYLCDSCNEHCMDDRIAAAMSRVAIADLTCRRSHPVGGQIKLELVEPPSVRRGTLCGLHVVRHDADQEVE